MYTVTHAFISTDFTSFTPISWAQVTNTAFGLSNINSVAFGNEKYLVVGDAGKMSISSTISSGWSLVANSSFGTAKIVTVSYGNNLFVAAGAVGKLATSVNGINWTQRSSSFGSATIMSVAYSSAFNKWYAVSNDGKIGTSVNGISWTLIATPFSSTQINTVYVGKIYTISSTEFDINGLPIVTYSGQDIVVAAGYEGKLATFTAGDNAWILRESGFVTDTIYDISSDVENRYVAIGDLGKVAISNGGTVWQSAYPSTSFGSSTIRTISVAPIYGTAFVAAGAVGKLATSYAGASWDQRTSSFGSSTINSILVTEDRAVAVGNAGKIAYSL